MRLTGLLGGAVGVKGYWVYIFNTIRNIGRVIQVMCPVPRRPSCCFISVVASQSQIPLLSKRRSALVPAPWVLGPKTRLESRIKKFMPHCICRWFIPALYLITRHRALRTRALWQVAAAVFGSVSVSKAAAGSGGCFALPSGCMRVFN